MNPKKAAQTDSISNQEWKAACKTYREGSNPTALMDWEVYGRLDRRRAVGRFATGLKGLDDLLGGLPHITLLAGPPQVGKSSLALELALGVLQQRNDTAVLYLSLDMGRTVVYDRLWCHVSGSRESELGLDHAEDDEQTLRAKERLRGEILPRLRVVDSYELSEESDLLSFQLCELLDASGMNRCLTIIDYLQLMPTPANLSSEVDRDKYRMRDLQDRRGPFLVISEVTKEAALRGSLSMQDVMGPARLGHAPDAMLLLEPTQAVNSDKDVVALTLTVAKARGAKRGTVQLQFDYLRYQFRELAGSRAHVAATSTAKIHKAAGRKRKAQ